MTLTNYSELSQRNFVKVEPFIRKACQGYPLLKRKFKGKEKKKREDLCKGLKRDDTVNYLFSTTKLFSQMTYKCLTWPKGTRNVKK